MRHILLIITLVIMSLATTFTPIPYVPEKNSSIDIDVSQSSFAANTSKKSYSLDGEHNINYAYFIVMAIIAAVFFRKELLQNDTTEQDNPEDAMQKISLRTVFEHDHLPKWFLGDPFNIVRYLVDYQEESIERWLENLINSDTDHILINDILSIDNIAVFYDYIDGVGYTIIKMPKPNRQEECFYIGLVVPDNKPLGMSRYITLEYKGDLVGNINSSLCEWTHDDTHLSYKSEVPARIDSFKSALISLSTTTPALIESRGRKRVNS